MAVEITGMAPGPEGSFRDQEDTGITGEDANPTPLCLLSVFLHPPPNFIECVGYSVVLELPLAEVRPLRSLECRATTPVDPLGLFL